MPKSFLGGVHPKVALILLVAACSTPTGHVWDDREANTGRADVSEKVDLALGSQAEFDLRVHGENGSPPARASFGVRGACDAHLCVVLVRANLKRLVDGTNENPPDATLRYDVAIERSAPVDDRAYVRRTARVEAANGFLDAVDDLMRAVPLQKGERFEVALSGLDSGSEVALTGTVTLATLDGCHVSVDPNLTDRLSRAFPGAGDSDEDGYRAEGLPEARLLTGGEPITATVMFPGDRHIWAMHLHDGWSPAEEWAELGFYGRQAEMRPVRGALTRADCEIAAGTRWHEVGNECDGADDSDVLYVEVMGVNELLDEDAHTVCASYEIVRED